MRGFRYTVATAVALVIGLSGLAMTSCTPPPVPAGCYDSTSDGNDVWFNGQMDVKDNAMLRTSTDGKCEGSDERPMTIVSGVDWSAANDKCLIVEPDTTNVLNMNEGGYSTMPADAYYCYPGVPGA